MTLSTQKRRGSSNDSSLTFKFSVNRNSLITASDFDSKVFSSNCCPEYLLAGLVGVGTIPAKLLNNHRIQQSRQSLTCLRV